MNKLRHALDDYLALRRSLGYKLERAGRLLADFVGHLETAGSDTITIDAALSWATRPSDADPSWWGHRLSVVRVFARHLHAIDPVHEVPPAGLLPIMSRVITRKKYFGLKRIFRGTRMGRGILGFFLRKPPGSL